MGCVKRLLTCRVSRPIPWNLEASLGWNFTGAGQGSFSIEGNTLKALAEIGHIVEHQILMGLKNLEGLECDSRYACLVSNDVSRT